MTGFQIRQLTLVGSGVPNAEIQFVEGLNVVSGPSDTGKTFIVQCIDFMLGSTDLPKSIPECTQYETVRLDLHDCASDERVVLERSIRGGALNLIRKGAEDRQLAAKHSEVDKDSISQYLLALSRLSDNKVRVNQQGKTRGVSFRDVTRLILVDEGTIIKTTSPILSDQFTAATAESGVFRLLLTGKEDSSLVAKEDPKISKGRRAGKVEMLNHLLAQTKSRLAEMQLSDDAQKWAEQLGQIDALYEAAKSDLNLEQQNVLFNENQRRNNVNSLRQTESRLMVLRELQDRFELLDQQYRSDLRRLETIAEAGNRLDQMSEERCPVCGAVAEHQKHEHQKSEATPAEVARACFAEAEKIKSLILDLEATRADNKNEIASVIELVESTRGSIRLAEIQFAEILKPRIDIALRALTENQGKRDQYWLALNLQGQINEFEGLSVEAGRKTSGTSAKLESNRIRTGEAEAFSHEVEVLLRSWNFPDLGRVTFSEDDQDIVIAGRQRRSHGKGIRAITHAAFNLALLSFCIKTDMPHPGLVLIDSPLVVYREPEGEREGFSHDVKNAFYRSIARDFHKSQVIIFENEDPPADLESSAHIIRFTGSSVGRQGFIPKIA